MSNDIIIASNATPAQVVRVLASADKLATKVQRQEVIPAYWEAAKWAVAQLELVDADGKRVWTGKALAESLGRNQSVMPHWKKVVATFTLAQAKKFDHWDACVKAAYGKVDGERVVKTVKERALDAAAKLETGSDVTAVALSLMASDVKLTATMKKTLQAAAAAL